MGVCGERNTWLSHFVVHAQHNAARTTNVDRSGSRSRLKVGKEANSAHVTGLT